MSNGLCGRKVEMALHASALSPSRFEGILTGLRQKLEKEDGDFSLSLSLKKRDF